MDRCFRPNFLALDKNRLSQALSILFTRRHSSGADPEEGPGGPGPPLFLHQTEARRADKNYLETAGPAPGQSY